MWMTFFTAKENCDALSQISITSALDGQVNWSKTMMMDKFTFVNRTFKMLEEGHFRVLIRIYQKTTYFN